ncbi:MAG: membrane or secreted protein, partial [Flavisolibacter sp.]|nr:membrane or secreted protein [Flavisolibacter sp.]
MKGFICLLFSLLILNFNYCFAQGNNSKNSNLVYVDKQGILRYTKDNAEAAFFGVNYTVPFAYGYRSHKALGVDLEKAIDADVYHMARLGLDAFRVHVWETEISDSLGNLKENEHLGLFDYLLSKLKERNIKIVLTPLAFWGPGYPEPDIKTGSFSSIWNKQLVLVTEAAIKAQENYLRQFLQHVNPYTKQTYGQDPDVLFLEINNEPHHSGTQQQAADYIARMIKAVKSTGWTKPIFYNISESPLYAKAVANAAIDGVSFQWYPTGLVANRTLKGNYLPNVDVYKIPFDTIPAYRNKARMVYEFDAGDVLQSNMYPAMVRSFRKAGFQWATQFAYDPMATAYGNTEYQTHYLNLAYTPSKAISLMIAAKAFHKLPRLKSYGTYPVDTVFDVFRVSYKNSLSEMNSEEEFYYSNTTATEPKSIIKLKHVAGVGNSPVVQYEGTGAYFLDKIERGMWRLEVMPDAIHIRDPFEKASPKKEVTRIQWQKNRMQIMLEDLGTDFGITAISKDNAYTTTSSETVFLISPGTYLITDRRTPKKPYSSKAKTGVLEMDEFSAPQPYATAPYIYHQPNATVTAGQPFTITAQGVGIDTADKLLLELRHTINKWKTLPLQQITAYSYTAEVPADMAMPGLLNYRIIVQKRNGDYAVFPGNHTGNPYAWDNYINESWQTMIIPATAPLLLFEPDNDRSNLNVYNPDWRNISFRYITNETINGLVQRITANKPIAGQIFGWQLYVGDKLQGRKGNLGLFDTVVIHARTGSAAPVNMKVALITKDAMAFAAVAPLEHQWKEIKIPIKSLQQDSCLLLP